MVTSLSEWQTEEVVPRKGYWMARLWDDLKPRPNCPLCLLEGHSFDASGNGSVNLLLDNSLYPWTNAEVQLLASEVITFAGLLATYVCLLGGLLLMHRALMVVIGNRVVGTKSFRMGTLPLLAAFGRNFYPMAKSRLSRFIKRFRIYEQSGERDELRRRERLIHGRLSVPSDDIAHQGADGFHSNSLVFYDRYFPLMNYISYIRLLRIKAGSLDGSSAEDSGFRIDYGKSIAEVYQEAAEYILTETRSLDILTIARPTSKRLPSWVPDWQIHRSFDRDPLNLLQKGANVNWDCCGIFNKLAPYRINYHSLRLRGFVISTISCVHDWNETFKYVSKKSDSKSWNRGIFEIFWRTLLAETDENGAEVPPHYGAEVLKILNTASTHQDGFSEGVVHAIESGTIPVARRKLAAYIASTVNSKRLASTVTQYDTLLPHHAAPGDLLCIIYGSRVPLVLRQAAAEYVLVGPCFVHGDMNGGAMDRYIREDETFILGKAPLDSVELHVRNGNLHISDHKAEDNTILDNRDMGDVSFGSTDTGELVTHACNDSFNQYASHDDLHTEFSIKQKSKNGIAAHGSFRSKSAVSDSLGLWEGFNTFLGSCFGPLREFYEPTASADIIRLMWSCKCSTLFHHDYPSHRRSEVSLLRSNLTNAGYKAIAVQRPLRRDRQTSAIRLSTVQSVAVAMLRWLECTRANLVFGAHCQALLDAASCSSEKDSIPPLDFPAVLWGGPQRRHIGINRRRSKQPLDGRQQDKQYHGNQQQDNQEQDPQQQASDGTKYQQMDNQRLNGLKAPRQTESRAATDGLTAKFDSETRSVCSQSYNNLSNAKLRWLLVCVQSKDENKKLLHVPLEASINDPELFHAVREAYRRQHFVFLRWFSWTGVTKLSYTRFRVGYDHSCKTQLAFLSGIDWAPPNGWQDHENWEPCPGSDKPSNLNATELEEFALHLFNRPHVGFREGLLRLIGKGRNSIVRGCRDMATRFLTCLISIVGKCIPRDNKSGLYPGFQDAQDIEMAPNTSSQTTDLELREDDDLQDCHLVFGCVPKRCNVELKANGSLPFGSGIVLDEGIRAPVLAKAIGSALLTAVVIGMVIACVALARRCSWTVSTVVAIPSLLVAVATLIVQT